MTRLSTQVAGSRRRLLAHTWSLPRYQRSADVSASPPADCGATASCRRLTAPGGGSGLDSAGGESPAGNSDSADTGGPATTGVHPDGVPHRTLLPPDWLDTDILGRESPRQQVLVVGDSVAGLVLTGLLRRAGFDPVLVAGAGGRPDSRLTYLWPAALRLLEPLGIEPSLRAGGTPVERATLDRPGAQTDGTTAFDRDSIPLSPLVVSSDALRDELKAAALGETAVQHRTVDTLERTGDALEVTFEDGVREWFDIVVDASGFRTGAANAQRRQQAVGQWEATVASADTHQSHIRDIWHDDALVQLLPCPDRSVRLLRLTTARADRTDALQSVDWGETPVSEGAVAAKLPRMTRTTARQAGVGAPTAPDWWGTGRVPCCGRAGFTTPPASGLQAALAIEDAWVLAEQLIGATDSVPDAVETYAHRRSQRVSALLEREVAEDPSLPATLASPLDVVGRLRTAALSPVRRPERAADGSDGS
jgi:2-polyprenyl-6-methoxyphenol hydroxylase-like FAD-dependent oxidoreductase